MRSAIVTINEKTYKANCISPGSAARIHNQYYKNGFSIDSHALKCNDTFSIKDDLIKLISFYGGEPRFIIYSTGEKQYDNINAKYHLGGVINEILF